MSFIWNTLLVHPILNILVALYALFGNMGAAIIVLTVLIRTLLIPVVMPSMKTMQKQRDLQPELDKIKEKFKYDKQKMAEEQMKLLQKHGVNPATGCLTQIVMILVLIALYNVINKFTHATNLLDINPSLYFSALKFASDATINTQFLYMNLIKPDPYFILPLVAGVAQFISSKMMMPYVEDGERAALATPDRKDDLAYNMQEQMLYMMPLMTVFIGASLPAGISLYLLITTLFSLVQQYFVSGWGGLKPWIKKLSFAAPKHK